MPFDAKARFTIGQFAKLHGINKKTLMWYDQIGLLKPAHVAENGYRYYSYQQSAPLENILMFRELGVSLEEIQGFMDGPTIDSLYELLTDKLSTVEKSIAQLRQIKEVMERQRQSMLELKSLDVSWMGLVELEGACMVAVDTGADPPIEKEIEQVIAEAKRFGVERLRDASYGSMLPVEAMYQGRFEDYSGVYIELQKPSKKAEVHMRPPGTYLRAYCQGDWDALAKRHEEMLDYAQQQGIELYGYAYERFINELVAHDMDDCITQIDIPARKKEAADL